MMKGQWTEPERRRYIVAAMFLLYALAIWLFYPGFGHVIFITNALPVLTVAILFGMWKALAMFAFCYLFSDLVLLQLVSGASLQNVLETQTSSESLLGAGTGLFVTILVGRLRDMNVKIARLHAEVLRLSKIDALTQLYNRGTLIDFLGQEIKRAQRAYYTEKPPKEAQLTVAMIDVDYFKVINDKYGHLVGDDVLKTLGAILSRPEILRASDVRGRYGGEEFLIILPQTTEENAIRIIERLNKAISKHSFAAAEGENFSITISCGIAKYQGNDDVQSFLKRADSALYRAKNSGRNRVEVY